MDIAHALDAMWADVVELATFDWVGRSALIGFIALPLASLVLVLRGDRVGWIPLGISFAMVSVWFLYYATGWWGQVSGPVGFWLAVLAFGIGWAIAIRQLLKRLRPVRS
ncbi:MAG: hypothetical protein GXP35_06245 [Actinobacteria bacterium]|nr:hypothetical protein [Actinomycetota bacterium]